MNDAHHSGNGALLLGHAHPAVIEALAAAASDGTHFGQDSPLTIENRAGLWNLGDLQFPYGNGADGAGLQSN